jgi:hypothetical protein
MTEILIIRKKQVDNAWEVTYKHYPKGECACLGVKITRYFITEPTNDDLIKAI